MVKDALYYFFVSSVRCIWWFLPQNPNRGINPFWENRTTDTQCEKTWKGFSVVQDEDGYLYIYFEGSLIYRWPRIFYVSAYLKCRGFLLLLSEVQNVPFRLKCFYVADFRKYDLVKYSIQNWDLISREFLLCKSKFSKEKIPLMKNFVAHFSKSIPWE